MITTIPEFIQSLKEVSELELTDLKGYEYLTEDERENIWVTVSYIKLILEDIPRLLKDFES